MTSFRTPAWRLLGLTRNEPGVLEHANGRLVYTPLDGDGFDVPLAEVRDVVFPWYYVGGGMKLTVAGERYRLSFVRPNGAEQVPGHLVSSPFASRENAWDLQPGLGEVARGRRVGKAWREALRS